MFRLVTNDANERLPDILMCCNESMIHSLGRAIKGYLLVRLQRHI